MTPTIGSSTAAAASFPFPRRHPPSLAFWHSGGSTACEPSMAARPRVIPARLDTDTRPAAGCDRPDPVGIVHREAPGFGAGLDNGVIAVPNAVAELVAAQVVPDIFHRVQFRRVGRQRQQGDVVGDREPLAAL